MIASIVHLKNMDVPDVTSGSVRSRMRGIIRRTLGLMALRVVLYPRRKLVRTRTDHGGSARHGGYTLSHTIIILFGRPWVVELNGETTGETGGIILLRRRDDGKAVVRRPQRDRNRRVGIGRGWYSGKVTKDVDERQSKVEWE